MKQLVLSDLHLGARSDTDLLRRPELREPLLAALDGVDRLVLLGDVLELRHGPAREPLAAARALFEALGRTLGPRTARSSSSPATTTTQLIAAWLEARGAAGARPLGLEHRVEPREASPLAEVAGGLARRRRR